MIPTKLPPYWVLRESKDYPGRVYYYNTRTSECTWIRPVIYPHLLKSETKIDWPPLVYVSHILIKHNESKDLTTWKNDHVFGNKKQALEYILNIKKKLENGVKKFAEMAEEESDDINSYQKGGEIGWIKRGQLDYGEAFDNIAFRLGLNKISNEPVESDYGWHLIFRLG